VTTRIGLVGAGFIGGRHLDSLSAQHDVRVVAVADPQVERAEQLAARAGARAHPGWQQLLDGEELDALDVCVPPHGHGAIEEAAIDRQVDPIEAEDRAFVATVRAEGDDVRAPYAEALRTHRLVTAVAAAATGDGVVALPEPAGVRS
jgi:predicted dehydrogenase